MSVLAAAWAWMKAHALAVGLAIVGAVLLIAYLLTRSKSLGLAAVSAIEAVHAPKILEAISRLDQAKGALGVSLDETQRLKEDIARRHLEIEAAHKLVGLSHEERSERYRKLKI